MGLQHEGLLHERFADLIAPTDPETELHRHTTAVDSLYERVQRGEYALGYPWEHAERLRQDMAKHRYMIIGAELGDEGKGRIVDNILRKLNDDPDIRLILVVRFQGGNNAGHTVEHNGIKLALHQVPSMVFHDKAVGIMEQGMVIHAEDLRTEVDYIEDAVGQNALRGRLILSPEAIFNTDLERAQEWLNTQKTSNAKGGTKRGMSSGYAGMYEKTGLKIRDLMRDDWEDVLGRQYDWAEENFAGHGHTLANIDVPDFRETKKTKEEKTRTVGTREIFIERMRQTRQWLIDRGMVGDPSRLYEYVKANEKTTAVVAEGAQAVGLNVYLGTKPDVTASDTSAHGIMAGTAGAWLAEEIPIRIGVTKGTYMSSVGVRRMPTLVDLSKAIRSELDLPAEATRWHRWAARVRRIANEFGTTTGRPRDICHTDLAFLKFNVAKGGINMLGCTHMDIASEDDVIRICTHYTNQNGNLVPYRPGLQHIEGVIPHYKEFAGWDGKAAMGARSFEELPVNAQKYLAFIQEYLGIPVVMATAGPERDNIMEFPQIQRGPSGLYGEYEDGTQYPPTGHDHIIFGL